MEFVLDLVLLFIAWAHVFISPYTKVEESFNLHATHDVFFYGVTKDGLKKYDHFIFPGAVPRSFLGSLWLGWTTRILATLLVPLGLIRTKFHVQIALRLVLTTANALALRRVRVAVSGRFGRITGIMFGLLTCSQFHMPFWMGRTLPNSFALVLFNEALSRTTWQPQALAPVIGLLCFSAVVFRAELAAYLGVFCIFILIRHRSWLVRLLLIGAVCTALSLTCTVVVDSYFWQDWPMWPEWRATYFNVVQGKSAEWGVSPFHVYWTQHLPKLLLGAFPLSLLGLVINRKARRLAIPAIAFVCVMSVLAHKEWRFVLYTVPIFNIAAACALTDLWARGTLTRLVALGILGANLVAMAGFTYVSSTNYPGGEALSVANRLNVSNANLHICNLAAQTGASLFLQEHSPPHLYKSQPGTKSWTYDKTEGLVILHPYTHAIVEELAVVEGWHVNATIEAYSGITKRGVRYTPSLWIVSNPHA